MVKVFVCLLCSIMAFAYADMAADEMSVQVNNSPTHPLIQAIDNAKATGNSEVFEQLLNEYKQQHPPLTFADHPEVIVHSAEPRYGQGSNMDWGTDVLVDSAWDYPSVSMDTRSDGFVFIAAEKCSTSSTTENIIPIWYSTTGTSWTHYFDIFWGGRDCRNPSCQVVETGSTEYIFVMFDGIQTGSPYETDVWVVVHEFGGSTWDYYAVSNLSGINEADPTLDADDYQYDSGVYLYCAFESGDSIAFMRSLDYGQTWTDRQILASGTANYDYLDPEIAYGWYAAADSFTLGVAWQYNETTGTPHRRIRFRASRVYGASGSWQDTEFFTSPTNGLDRYPRLRMTHGTMPSGCILFSRTDTVGTDNSDLDNFFTYNGGRDWDVDTLYYGGNYTVLTALANDHTANDYHAFFRGDNDNMRYKEAHYDDFTYDGWSFSIVINDAGQTMSSSTHPAIAVLNEEPCVVWKDITNGTWYKLYFDALWTGIEEQTGSQKTHTIQLSPSVSNGPVRLSYTIATPGQVIVNVYDATGSLVNTVDCGTQSVGNHTLTLNNNGLASGIYFIKITTPETSMTTKMVISR